jgi:transcriptional regulator with XRE-family HTH domain
MSEPDPKTTLREFREYVASSHESHSKIAARIGVSQWAIWNWLTGKQPPAAKSLVRLRAFLDAEAKRALQGDGIRPVEPVPYKVIKTVQQVQYARLCPFCRKERGEIRKLGAGSFRGVCPKCGARGPTREGHQKPYELGMGENSETAPGPCGAGQSPDA